MMKAAGIGGSILALIALLLVVLKQLSVFIGFITLAVKILIVIAFIGLFAGIAFMVFKSWQSKRKYD